MANYCLTFSEQLEHLTDEERTWLEQQLDEEKFEQESVPRFLVECSNDDTECGFSYEFLLSKASGQHLWLYSEESGNPHHVGILVQKFLQIFRPQECWSLSYACECDRPRIGEFGGGALFVTADKIEERSTGDLIHEWQQAFTAGQQRPT